MTAGKPETVTVDGLEYVVAESYTEPDGSEVLTLRSAPPATAISSPEAILAAPFEHRDGVADTIGGYLVALLRQLWTTRDGFDSKRPFGFSGWRTSIVRSLVDGGHVRATLATNGTIAEYDQDATNRSVLAAIDALAGSWPAS